MDVGPADHQHLIADHALLPGKDVCGQVGAGQMPEMTGTGCVRPGDGDEDGEGAEGGEAAEEEEWEDVGEMGCDEEVGGVEEEEEETWWKMPWRCN